MTTIRRVAVCAALLALAAAGPLRAQSGSIRVTLTGGSHPGTYQMDDLCELLTDGFPNFHIMAAPAGPRKDGDPRSMEFFSASAKGRPDGFVLAVLFSGAGQTRYEIFAMPADLWPKGTALPTSGSGTASIKTTASGKEAVFRGTTKDGVKMEGKASCSIGGEEG